MNYKDSCNEINVRILELIYNNIEKIFWFEDKNEKGEVYFSGALDDFEFEVHTKKVDFLDHCVIESESVSNLRNKIEDYIKYKKLKEVHDLLKEYLEN